jgi:ABC-type multidrug transport system fused ATPase/permease subunit
LVKSPSAKSKYPRRGHTASRTIKKGIEIRSLSFAYAPDKPVLNEISFNFEAGKSYAVVGASGCGKSTLLNLLLAAHDQYSGSILYDGMEQRTISSQSLYELISIIEQNVFVFNASIVENITMFRPFPQSKSTAP